MKSLKVVVIVVAVLVCLVAAKNNKGNKYPKNSPHLKPCTTKEGFPGQCRNNGNCTNIRCTKFCRAIPPNPCDPNPCGATATCNVPTGGGFTCTCENGDILVGEPCQD